MFDKRPSMAVCDFDMQLVQIIFDTSVVEVRQVQRLQNKV
jgi:hypothetical protein